MNTLFSVKLHDLSPLRLSGNEALVKDNMIEMKLRRNQRRQKVGSTHFLTAISQIKSRVIYAYSILINQQRFGHKADFYSS